MISSELATRDLLHGVTQWRIWCTLGWQDIRQRYRRTLIGPFWLTLSMLVMIGGMGLVFSTVLHMDISRYIPYLGSGLVAWGLISSIFSEAPVTFLGAQRIIHSMTMPLSVHLLRMLWRQLLVFLHNLAAFIVIAVWFKIPINLATLLLLPGLLIMMLNGFWLGLLLGTFGARFRDLQQIITTALLLLFFVTPIIWSRDQIGERYFLVDFNPLFHLLDILRAPMLGEVPSMLSYIVATGMIVVGSFVAYPLFRHFRWRVAYWL